MKISKIFLLITAVFLCAAFHAHSQKLAQQYNLRQKSAFTENKGQVADQNGMVRKDVKYLYSAPGHKLVLKNNSFSYEIFTLEKKKKQEFSEATGENAIAFTPPYEGGARGGFKTPEEVTVKTHRIDVSFVGANPDPVIIAEERSENYNNYYLAHTPEEGVTNVLSYSKLTYKNLYPNIDIVFYAKEEGKLKYDIVVHPAGKLENVKMKYDGADVLALKDGRLKIITAQGEINEEIPYSFLKETKQNVKANYVKDGNIISFHTDYDKSQTLIIDPLLSWSTYYGGGNYDNFSRISLDSAGNIYGIGGTQSTSSIATSGAHQTSFIGSGFGVPDAFIVKFNNNGIRQWGTYFGGTGYDEGTDLTTDNNYLYLTGYTASTSGIASTGTHQTSIGGSYDVFIVKFNLSGSRQWGSYLGGSGSDIGSCIELDKNGNIFITGGTTSTSSIATSGAPQTTIGGNQDAFIVKFNNNGVRLWGTYFGDIGDDSGSEIRLDSNYFYLAGSTKSSSNISTSGAHQTTLSNTTYSDAFLIKFNINGIRQWGTYFGGNNVDYITRMKINTNGQILITGETLSNSNIASIGAYQTTFSGNRDAFLVKFNSSGVRQWGTYFGGTGDDQARDLVIDDSSNIYFIGYTSSTSSIVSSGAFQTSYGGGAFDAFIAKFKDNGQRHWSTYYGSSDRDIGNSIEIDKFRNIYISGSTNSSFFKTTTGAHQTTYGGNTDGFLTKFCNANASLVGINKVCSGSTSYYTAKKDTNLTYNWTVDGGTIVAGSKTDSITVLWGSAGTGSVKVVVNAPASCKDSITLPITINPLPVANVGTGATICSGNSTTIGGSAVTGSTYSWISNPAGFTSAVSRPVVSPAVTTTYYLTETITATGCEKTDSVTITVNPPIANNTITALHNICLGQASPIIIGSTPTGGGGSYNYKWESSTDSINWSVITGAQDSSFTPAGNPLQTIWYRRTVTTTTCTGSLASVSNVGAVKVNPRPRPAINGDRFFCAEKVVKYGIRSGAGSTVIWSVIGGQLISGQNTDTVLVEWLTSGNGTVKVIETNSFGCSDSASVSVTIYPLPVANFTASRECIGKTTSFTNTSTLGTSYTWSFGDGDSATIVNPKHTYKAAGTYQVTLIATSTTGCKDTITKAVIVDSLPAADFSFKNTCFGDSTVFANTSSSAASVLWNFGDGNTTTLENPLHQYINTGTFTVKLKVWNSAGCPDSVSKTITINPLPFASISVIKDTTADRSFTFFGNTNATHYLWSFGDGKIDSGKTVKHTYQKDSIYKISLAVRDTNGCAAFTDTTITVFTVGVNELQAHTFDIKLYPNPFSNATSLEYNLQESAKTQISIYDLTGNEIAVLQNGIQQNGRHKLNINAEKYHLKSGIYILKIIAGNYLISRQLIKLKE